MNPQANYGEIGPEHETVRARVRGGQHGGARLRALIWTAILLSFLFVCYKVIPPYFANYQLEDWLKTQIPFYMVNHTTDEALYTSIIKEMHSEGIEVTKDNIKIVQNNSQGINVQISYDVKLDFMVYQATLHFTPQMNSQALVQ
jgi:hypothetical protein